MLMKLLTYDKNREILQYAFGDSNSEKSPENLKEWKKIENIVDD